MKKVYLAGPDMFKPRAKMIGETLKKAMCIVGDLLKESE